jgi:putative membrane protein
MWSRDGSWAWWGPGVLFLILCMVVMVRMMGHGHGHGHGSHRSHAGGAAGHRAGEAERILAERLARGEIDIEDHERRLAALNRTGDLGRA